MKIQQTTQVADTVLRELRRRLASYVCPLASTKVAYVYPYINGRERGWTLQLIDGLPAFTFSEFRNSDEVVVYEDPDWNPFLGTGGTPSDAVFVAKQFFKTPEAAADHIDGRVRALCDAKAVADAVVAR